jgi:hypothetical protein
MQNDLSMTFARRLATAAGISLVLTLLLMLIFQADATPPPSEAFEASGGSPALSEPGIRPISLRSAPPN